MSNSNTVILPREVVEQVLEALIYCEAPDSSSEEQRFQAAIALRAALEQPKNHIEQHLGMVPAGWKLVPVEPKISMKQAALNASRRWAECDAPLPRTQELLASEVCWKAMIEAAPQPPTVKECLTVEQRQGEQQPVALLADAIRAEPTELIHKWRVLELIQDHARQQPKREPLTNEQVKAGLIQSIEYTDARERCAFNIGVRFAERAHGIK